MNKTATQVAQIHAPPPYVSFETLYRLRLTHEELCRRIADQLQFDYTHVAPASKLINRSRAELDRAEYAHNYHQKLLHAKVGQPKETPCHTQLKKPATEQLS